MEEVQELMMKVMLMDSGRNSHLPLSQRMVKLVHLKMLSQPYLQLDSHCQRRDY